MKKKIQLSRMVDKLRMIFFALITWLPLFVLTLFAGTGMPFILDYEVHVRFLLVLSTLIFAEVIAQDRLQCIVSQFLKCNIISRGDRTRFNDINDSAIRLKHSLSAQVIILLLVYTLGLWISSTLLMGNVSSWFADTTNTIIKLTTAGYWYVFISLPIFQFILFRWYFRLFVWYRFLWQISRLPLQLNSLHPDRAGGLGFLAISIHALLPLLLAHTMLLAGLLLSHIWIPGAVISDFRLETVCIFVLILLIPIIPLLFFMGQMVREKRNGTLNYAVVANHYVNDFRQKWITKSDAKILGSSDIQSLADLSNSFEVTSEMRVLPFNKSDIISLAIVIALPLFLVFLTTMPIDKIINQLSRLIF